MTLEYRWEKFSALIPELPRLFKLHYDEVITDKDRLQMDFKWNRHLDMENMGVLKVMTARSDGMLVGYVLWLINENLNFLIVNAITSLYFLDPLYRPGGDDGLTYGQMLFTESEQGLKEMGAGCILITSPSGATTPAFDRMMKVMGYKPFQNVYSKFL